MAKKADIKDVKSGIEAEDHSGRMKVLTAVKYEKGMVYVRQIDEELFIWDAVYKGELYSSYIIITLPKGKTKHATKIVNEARQMCYAGAAATIDTKMGKKLSKEELENINLFESAREKVEKEG